jgi:hypothetical protein
MASATASLPRKIPLAQTIVVFIPQKLNILNEQGEIPIYLNCNYSNLFFWKILRIMVWILPFKLKSLK